MTSPFSEAQMSLSSPESHQDRPPAPGSQRPSLQDGSASLFLYCVGFFFSQAGPKPSKARNVNSEQRHEASADHFAHSGSKRHPGLQAQERFPKPQARGSVWLPLRLRC